jgi:hypothetical protein
MKAYNISYNIICYMICYHYKATIHKEQVFQNVLFKKRPNTMSTKWTHDLHLTQTLHHPVEEYRNNQNNRDIRRIPLEKIVHFFY